MMSYAQDIFYNTQRLSLETKHSILTDARQKSFNWWVDILDCFKSAARQRIEIDFNEILAKLDDSCYFVFINRKGFNEKEYRVETGFCTMIGSVNYYLWIQIKENYLKEFIEKYQLQRMS
jgi:hypothetical protein